MYFNVFFGYPLPKLKSLCDMWHNSYGSDLIGYSSCHCLLRVLICWKCLDFFPTLMEYDCLVTIWSITDRMWPIVYNVPVLVLLLILKNVWRTKLHLNEREMNMEPEGAALSFLILVYFQWSAPRYNPLCALLLHFVCLFLVLRAAIFLKASVVILTISSQHRNYVCRVKKIFWYMILFILSSPTLYNSRLYSMQPLISDYCVF